MFEKYKNVKITGIIVIFIVVIAILFSIFNKKTELESDNLYLDVYFLNPTTGTLEPEIRTVKKGSNREITEEVIKILYEGPNSKSLVKIFPPEVKFLDGELIENAEFDKTLLKTKFSKEYKDMKPTEELFFRSSFVWTMTDLDFIEDVQVFVEEIPLKKINGEEIGALNRTNIVLNPVIYPYRVESQEIKLYFLDEKTMKLAPENRVVQVNPDRSIENYVIEELIKGPTTDILSPILPQGAELREDVKTEDGICYVDFSNDIMFKNSISPEILAINVYSIVNSLTDIPEVKKVQFLIEGAKIDGYKDIVDLSNPIERNESIIQTTK